MTDTETVPRKPDREPASKPLVDDQLADELLGRAQAEGVELLGPDGLLSRVTRAVLERALGEEMTHHLGYDKHDPAGRGSSNSRNGTTGKRLLTEVGSLDLEVPRDSNGSFTRRSCARARPVWTGSTTESSRCTRVGCPPATSAPICARCM